MASQPAADRQLVVILGVLCKRAHRRGRLAAVRGDVERRLRSGPAISNSGLVRGAGFAEIYVPPRSEAFLCLLEKMKCTRHALQYRWQALHFNTLSRIGNAFSTKLFGVARWGLG